MPAKAPDAYFHGDEGPVVIVTAHVAAYLSRRMPLDRLRGDARDMRDAEVYHVLNALRRAALTYESALAAPAPVIQQEPRDQERMLSSSQAGALLHLTARGVRDACEKGRLEAQQVDGRWQITRAAVRRYRDAS